VGEIWAVLGALAIVVLPMALAGWLLGRPPRGARPRQDAHGKMPAEEER
jgi:hypothetical protein